MVALHFSMDTRGYPEYDVLSNTVSIKDPKLKLKLLHLGLEEFQLSYYLLPQRLHLVISTCIAFLQLQD